MFLRTFIGFHGRIRPFQFHSLSASCLSVMKPNVWANDVVSVPRPFCSKESPGLNSPEIFVRSFRSSAPFPSRKSMGKDDGPKAAAQMKKRKIGSAVAASGLLCYFIRGPEDLRILTYLLSHILIPAGLFIIAISFL